jgi:agmatinase
MGFQHVTDLDRLDAHVAIIGLPYGDPYSIDQVSADQTNGPTALRRASKRISLGVDCWDFDIGGTLFNGKPIRVVDVGDVPGDPRDLGGHYGRAEAAARRIFATRALLIAVGGDTGVPIPVFRALSICAPVILIQINAHLDWRDEVNGVREGYSSTIRRASEMPHIASIFQIGIRGQGSAGIEEVEAARRYGANIITVFELEDRGVNAILARIPSNASYYLHIDADGLDPSVMPAVGLPAPGGLTYRQMIEIVKGLVKKGRLLGMDIVDVSPARDINEITSITAGHIILNAIGAAVRAGYFD